MGAAICCAPTGNSIGTIEAIRISRNSWASFPPPSARICGKERQAVKDEGISFDWLTGKDITEGHWDRFFTFYMDTGGRKWGHPYLTRDFFSRIGQSMAGQIVLIMARRGREHIAGALNLMGEGTLLAATGGRWIMSPFCISRPAIIRQ